MASSNSPDESATLTNQTLTPRSYQTELLNHVIDRNSIICMGTGTGKTFIAVMLIKEKAHEIEKPFLEGGKRTFFITNSVTLARQQGDVIRKHTNLKVQTYVGADGVDEWMIEPKRWEIEFVRNQVLVMTAQILLNILQHGILAFSKINLIIFDECHHAKKNHAYVKIMEIGSEMLSSGEEAPHILGLTASILDRDLSSCDKLEENIKKIENKLHSTVITSSDQDALEKYGTKPFETLLEYEQEFEDKYGLIAKLSNILDSVYEFLARCEFGYKMQKLNSSDVETEKTPKVNDIPDGLRTVMRNLEDYRLVLNSLGPVAAEAVSEKYINKLKKDAKTPAIPVEVNRRFFRLGISIFLQLQKEYDDFYDETITTLDVVDELCHPRVKKLIQEILYKYGQQNQVTDEAVAEGCRPAGSEESDDDDDFIIEKTEVWNEDEDKEEENVEEESDAEEEEDDEEEEEEEEEEDGKDDGEDNNSDFEDEVCLNEELTGIVFVERRVTAFALHKFLEVYFSWDENLSTLKSGYIVGGGGKPDQTEVHQTIKHQEATLRQFRNKKINLLVSTSVLQEGIDIPKCNLVVLFEAPKNYREYVQAKGRARAANSFFYILASDLESGDCEKRLSNYQALEEVIASKCLTRDQNTDDEEIDDVDRYLPPYKGPVIDGKSGKTQAMVSMSSAVGLINQYCNLLPADTYTRLSPECVFTEVGTQFRCTIQLPISSPVRDPVTSDPMPRKKLAQMAAALKICELLHKCGELNDFLLPSYGMHLTSVREHEDHGVTVLKDGCDPVDEQATRITKADPKRRRIHAKCWAECLKENIAAGQSGYVYEICVSSAADMETSNSAAGGEKGRKFGMLVRKKLPRVPDFPIFIRKEELIVRLALIDDRCVLNEAERERALVFHRYLFLDLLNIERDAFTDVIYDFDQGFEKAILIPVTRTQDGCGIDWDFLNLIVSKKHIPYQCYGKKFKWDEEKWTDAVVTRTYREPPLFYHINKICKDMNPYSRFPNDMYSTFDDYYSTRYAEIGLKIKNKTQPLLDVTMITKRFNLLTSKYQRTTGDIAPTSEKDRHYTHFVPELCGIHVFPASMWHKVVMLPSILYRLSSLFKAHQLRERIIHAGICVSDPRENCAYPKLDYGFKLQGQLRPEITNGSSVDQTKLKDEQKINALVNLIGMEDVSMKRDAEFELRRSELEEVEKIDLFAEIRQIPTARYGPSPGHILQALTLAAANDMFSLERMELIGDSFLKYTMSVYLFLTRLDDHEGKLTSRRMAVISNTNLFNLGVEKKIPGLIVALHFAPNDNFVPPGYTVQPRETKILEGKRGQEDRIVGYCTRTQNLLHDKSVADCMEALIGCYLITSGPEAARKLLQWFGLPLEVKDWNQLPKKIYNPILKTESDWQVKLERLTAGLHVLEESLQYKFRNKAYLVEALTHPSYQNNRVTQNYQRLEFLGDAVLDYVLTRFLFEDSRQHSPGLLTDLRSALVSNNTFAKLAVKYGYHLSFKYSSPSLYYLIDRFVNSQQENGHELFDEGFENIEEPGFEDVDIPKALGDIFESVAGAIYLDSGLSLDAVWNVHYAMMKDLIVRVTLDMPKSPIRELSELAPNSVTFSPPVRTESGKLKVTVTILGNRGKYSGIARTQRLARVAAAKKAVRKLKEAEQTGFYMGQV